MRRTSALHLLISLKIRVGDEKRLIYSNSPANSHSGVTLSVYKWPIIYVFIIYVHSDIIILIVRCPTSRCLCTSFRFCELTPLPRPKRTVTESLIGRKFSASANPGAPLSTGCPRATNQSAERWRGQREELRYLWLSPLTLNRCQQTTTTILAPLLWWAQVQEHHCCRTRPRRLSDGRKIEIASFIVVRNSSEGCGCPGTLVLGCSPGAAHRVREASSRRTRGFSHVLWLRERCCSHSLFAWRRLVQSLGWWRNDCVGGVNTQDDATHAGSELPPQWLPPGRYHQTAPTPPTCAYYL